MAGILKIGGTVISSATRRLEMSAHNLSNVNTHGYRAHRLFEELVVDSARSPLEKPHDVLDPTPGKLVPSANPLDLTIKGQGLFVVQSAKGETFYSRGGQFARDADGRLVTAGGLALQSEAGDVVVQGHDVTVAADGTILDDGQPSARLAIVDAADPQSLRSVGNGLLAAEPDQMRPMPVPQVAQGMIETSNVSAADEMIAIMASLRSAESGQRIVQIYDDLMGRAITAFGQT